ARRRRTRSHRGAPILICVLGASRTARARALRAARSGSRRSRRGRAFREGRGPLLARPALSLASSLPRNEICPRSERSTVPWITFSRYHGGFRLSWRSVMAVGYRAVLRIDGDISAVEAAREQLYSWLTVKKKDRRSTVAAADWE